MKKLLPVLLFALLAATVAVAQKPRPSTGKRRSAATTSQTATTDDGRLVILKSDNTWQYAAAAPETPPPRKSSEVTIKGALPADPQRIALFPSEYESKIVKISNVRIDDLKAIPNSKGRLFALGLTTEGGRGTNYYASFSPSNDLNFVTSETITKFLQPRIANERAKTISRFDGNINLYANISLLTESNNSLLMATVFCIEVGNGAAFIGNCE